MHGQEGGSSGPRIVMVGLHSAGVGTAAYLLLAGGVSLRDGVLLGCSLTYLLRFLVTTFYLLRRGVDWSEAGQVAPFLFVIHATFGYLGSRSMVPWRWSDWAALALYGMGSFLNTGSELQRRLWKLKPEHKGRLYTGGLFSLSMHINYFGDTVLFTGFAWLTTSVWAFLIPLVMTTLFVFVHIPALDRYLARRYPEELPRWSRHTRKFVPFIY